MKLSMPDKFTSGNIYDVRMLEHHLTAPSWIQCEEAYSSQNTFGTLFPAQVPFALCSSRPFFLACIPRFSPHCFIFFPSSELLHADNTAWSWHWITHEFISCLFLLLLMTFVLNTRSFYPKTSLSIKDTVPELESSPFLLIRILLCVRHCTRTEQ